VSVVIENTALGGCACPYLGIRCPSQADVEHVDRVVTRVVEAFGQPALDGLGEQEPHVERSSATALEPSAVMRTSIATGMRVPRMQRAPP